MKVNDILNTIYTKQKNDTSFQKLFEENIVLRSFYNVLLHQNPETEMDVLDFLFDVMRMNQILQEEIIEILGNNVKPSKIVVPEGSKVIN